LRIIETFRPKQKEKDRRFGTSNRLKVENRKPDLWREEGEEQERRREERKGTEEQ
jgi:hypothetical protein